MISHQNSTQKPDFVYNFNYTISSYVPRGVCVHPQNPDNSTKQAAHFFFYPNGLDLNSEGHASVYLSLPEDSILRKHKTIFKLQFAQDSPKPILCEKSIEVFDIPKRTKVGCDKFVKLCNTMCTFKLRCEVYVVPEQTLQVNKLSIDMADLFKTMKFADITLVVDNKKFPAHKAILATRSSAFDAMLEPTSNCVEINDITADILVEMLNFIYTGQAPNRKKLAVELLAAADKYALEDLKMLCVQEICLSISVETAAAKLQLADLYNLGDFKKQTPDFIDKCIQVEMATEYWKKLVNTNAKLLNEVLQVFAEKHIEKNNN